MKKEFMVERQGKSFCLYAGLLDEAHSQGLKAIRTKLLQIPIPDNGQVAICYAEVETEKGTFTGLGDAAPENVSRMMLPHLIRMAETRSKARALRDAVNVGVAAVEELGDHIAEDEARNGHEQPAAAGRPAAPAPAAARPAAAPQAQPAQRPAAPQGRPAAAPPPIAPAATGTGATPAQVRAIYLIGRDQHGLSEAQVEDRSMAAYGCLPSELNRRQASELITSLKG